MDFLAEYLPQLFTLYTSYSTTYHPYIAPIYRAIFLIQSYVYRYVFPLVFPIYTITNKALQSLSSDSPDFLTLLLLGLILLVSFKVLDYMRRTIIFWVTLALRMTFILFMAGIAVYIWQRGLQQSLEDLGWFMGLFEGLFDEGQRVGTQKAKGRERAAKGAQQAGTHPRGRTRGAGW